MAKSLLNAVNDTLKRLRVISGESGELSSLTDSARQTEIDVVVQIWNDLIREAYSISNKPLPQEETTTTITLVASQREYTLPSDLVQITFPLTDTTNNDRIYEYPGGFEQMDRDQIDPSTYTGVPNWAAINPQNGKLRLNTIPQAADAGRAYTLRYDKEIALSAAADTFPFNDAAVKAATPIVAEIYAAEKRGERPVVSAFMTGQFIRMITQRQKRRQW